MDKPESGEDRRPESDARKASEPGRPERQATGLPPLVAAAVAACVLLVLAGALLRPVPKADTAPAALEPARAPAAQEELVAPPPPPVPAAPLAAPVAAVAPVAVPAAAPPPVEAAPVVREQAAPAPPALVAPAQAWTNTIKPRPSLLRRDAYGPKDGQAAPAPAPAPARQPTTTAAFMPAAGPAVVPPPMPQNGDDPFWSDPKSQFAVYKSLDPRYPIAGDVVDITVDGRSLGAVGVGKGCGPVKDWPSIGTTLEDPTREHTIVFTFAYEQTRQLQQGTVTGRTLTAVYNGRRGVVWRDDFGVGSKTSGVVPLGKGWDGDMDAPVYAK